MKIALLTRQFRAPFVGVDVNADRLRRALLRQGHEVVVLAFDHEGTGREPTVGRDSDEWTAIWRIGYELAALPPQSFHHAYDPLMGAATQAILAEERPALSVIMNFYTLTLATVEASKQLGIPVAHVATDFLPICRRGSLIRWDGASCEQGESVVNCAACYLSERPAARLAARALPLLPEPLLLPLARRAAALPWPGPLRPLASLWGHLSTMEERLQRLPDLRAQIDLVLAPTRYTARAFLQTGFRAEQVRLLPFGVERDHPLATLTKQPADHLRFLFLGRFQPYKGLHLLLEAFNALERPSGATLTLYGAADGHEGYLAELRRGIRANPRIHWGGQLPPTQVARAFEQADYLVLPSTWHENLPLVLLESLQSHTPVIASAVAGVTDLLHEGVNGLLFPMGDVAALRAQLQRAIDEPPLRARLAAGATLYDVDDYARELVAHFDPCGEAA